MLAMSRELFSEAGWAHACMKARSEWCCRKQTFRRVQSDEAQQRAYANVSGEGKRKSLIRRELRHSLVHGQPANVAAKVSQNVRRLARARASVLRPAHCR